MNLYPSTYNVEHLIISQSHDIIWTSKDYEPANPPPNTKCAFTKADFAACDAWRTDNCHWMNYIWIDKDFNSEQLANYDIVTKIRLLRGTLDKNEKPQNRTYAKKHNHIEVICQHIMCTEGFDKLLCAYNSNASRDEVISSYMVFLDNYFSEDSMEKMCQRINEAFATCLNELFKWVDN